MNSEKETRINQKIIAILLILIGAILISVNLGLMSKLEWGFIVVGIICILVGLFGGMDTSPRKHD